MAYKDKFYYIDSEGNKKKYIGKVISNKDSYNGILTLSEKSTSNKDLIYHPEVEEVKGYSSYYSYINSKGEDIIYFDNMKKDEDGNVFFTYTERELFKLNYNPEILPSVETFTYIDPITKEEKPYTGKITYNRRTGSYTGVIQI